MLNRILNSIVLMIAKYQMRKYNQYPVISTAVVLVNVQNAFLTSPLELITKLENLITFARQHGFQVIYAPYGSNAENPFPTPAQSQMQQQLTATKNGFDVPEKLALQDSDVVIKSRNKLSAFVETNLNSHLKNTGIEHLIFAGPLANITLDSSARDGVELGYHVTIISDCTSAATIQEKQFSTQVTFPRFVQTVVNLSDFQRLALITKPSI
jgi:nicotinamidase-related amidase